MPPATGHDSFLNMFSSRAFIILQRIEPFDVCDAECSREDISERVGIVHRLTVRTNCFTLYGV